MALTVQVPYRKGGRVTAKAKGAQTLPVQRLGRGGLEGCPFQSERRVGPLFQSTLRKYNLGEIGVRGGQVRVHEVYVNAGDPAG